MMRDTWRAVLVLAVILVVRHEADVWQGVVRAVGPPPSGETGSQVAAAAPSLPQQPVAVEAWRPVVPVQPQPVMQQAAAYPVYGNQYTAQQQRGPLRQVGSATVDLAEALIGVVRR